MASNLPVYPLPVQVYVTEMDADGSGETTLWEGGIERAIGNESKALKVKLFLVIEWLRRIEFTEIILHLIFFDPDYLF